MNEYDGLVYYVLDADRLNLRVKIGTTTDLQRRLVALRSQTVAKTTPLVLALEAGGRELEADRHQRFAHLRVGGEWFRYADDLVTFLRSLQNPVALVMDDPSLWQYARGWSVIPDMKANSGFDNRILVAPRPTLEGSTIPAPDDMTEIEF